MGVINLFFASFMALFPRSLPRAEIRRRLENAGSSAKVKVEISFKGRCSVFYVKSTLYNSGI